MKYITFGQDQDQVSQVILGTMNLAQLSAKDAEVFLKDALDAGINFWDTADCYADGGSEERLGEVFAANPGLREKVFLQSKCGIRNEDGVKFFDFSAEHILQAVDASLERLKTENLDCLLLHRPDVLMEPEEIADAFRILHKTGKVRNFGVSNMNPAMIRRLQKYTKYKLETNQIQMSCAFSPVFDAALHVNMQTQSGVMRDGGIMEYCAENDMAVQAWSPLRYGFFEGIFLSDPKFEKLNSVLERIAGEQNVTPTAVALAWILRYPARMQAVIGTTKSSRMKESALAAEVTLDRRQWYEIYQAAGNDLP